MSLVILGCDKGTQLPKTLEQSFEEYYESEKNKDWETLYQYRRKIFQDTVPLDVFLREMNKYSSEFNLVSHKIVEAKLISSSEAIITSDFKVRAELEIDSAHSAAFKNGLSSEFTEKGIVGHWIKIDNRWFLLGSNRLFQPMSSRIVHDS